MNQQTLMSENINEIMGALAKAQGKIQPASKDKSNPFFKSKYADLSSVWDACREALSENGLAVVQTIQQKQEGMFLITTLGHSSGQWIKSEVQVILAKTDPQAIGSAITYFRRYSLSAMVGVAPDDDDGEKAQQSFRNQKTQDIKPKPKITAEQASELEMILEECEDKYKNLVYESIKKHYNTDEISDLSLEVYHRIKNAAVKNMEANHAFQRGELLKQEPLLQEAVQ